MPLDFESAKAKAGKLGDGIVTKEVSDVELAVKPVPIIIGPPIEIDPPIEDPAPEPMLSPAGRILNEYHGVESDIPVNSPYWRMTR